MDAPSPRIRSPQITDGCHDSDLRKISSSPRQVGRFQKKRRRVIEGARRPPYSCKPHVLGRLPENGESSRARLLRRRELKSELLFGIGPCLDSVAPVAALGL